MAREISTIQSNIKNSKVTSSITKYALFAGGINATHDVLKTYDPLKTGYGRLFMVRKPLFLEKTIPTKLKAFKHILEYGNTSVQGINDITVNFNEVTGGYVGKSFEIPSIAQDTTTNFSVGVYEFSGSPIREVLHTWINGTTDLLTGLAHYNGLSLDKTEANQTAEFVYVSTDNTGENVEYACLFANCFPGGIQMNQFNYTSGQHELVPMTIEFHCIKYESMQINKLGQSLLDRYKVLANSLNFFSGISSKDNDTLGTGFGYDVATGQLSEKAKGKDTNTPLTASQLASV